MLLLGIRVYLRSSLRANRINQQEVAITENCCKGATRIAENLQEDVRRLPKFIGQGVNGRFVIVM